MLTRFIKEHKALFREVELEWRERFLSLSFDQGRAQEFVDFLYKTSDKYYRVKTFFVESPLAIYDLAFQDSHPEIIYFLNRKFRDRHLPNRLAGPIERSIHSKIVLPIKGEVKNYLLSRFWATYASQVEDQVDDHIRKYFNYGFIPENKSVSDLHPVKYAHCQKVLQEVKTEILRKVWEQNRAEDFPPNTFSYSQFWQAIITILKFDLRLKSLHSMEFCLFGGFRDIAWVWHYDTWHRLGVVKKIEFILYKELSKANNFLLLPLSKCAVVVKPPSVLNLDDRDRLHCIDGPALRFADGYKQHWVSGVFFDWETFDKFFVAKDFSGKDILKLNNLEHKSVLIQHYGFESIIDDLQNKKTLDTYQGVSRVTGRPVTYELVHCFIDNNPVRFVQVEDHSSHKVVTLGVPVSDETSTCLGAVAWTFGMSEEEYAPLMET